MFFLLSELVLLTLASSNRLTTIAPARARSVVQNWSVSPRSGELISLVKPAVLDQPPSEEQALLRDGQLAEDASLISQLEGDQALRLSRRESAGS
jgi:hypothetical protein